MIGELVRHIRGVFRPTPVEVPKRKSGRPKKYGHLAEHMAYLYTIGRTTTEIDALLGLPRTTSYIYLRRAGVKMRPKGHNATRGLRDTDRAAEMVRLRTEEHLSLEQIGERFGITRERARQVLAKAGVDNHAAMVARYHATAKKYNRQAAVCKVCGEDYGKGNWRAHRQATRCSPQLDYARDELVAADYAAGMLQREIMVRHGVEATAIARAVKRLGIPKRRPQTAHLHEMAASKRRKERIASEYAAGGDLDEIAARHGVSKSWVYMIARERGIYRPISRRKAS